MRFETLVFAVYSILLVVVVRKDSAAFRKVAFRYNRLSLRFHDLRHKATSRLFEKGFDIMEVAAITGHKMLVMLKRYTHLRAVDLAPKLE